MTANTQDLSTLAAAVVAAKNSVLAKAAIADYLLKANTFEAMFMVDGCRYELFINNFGEEEFYINDLLVSEPHFFKKLGK